MGKAKRKGGLSGVSRFVFESMKSDPSNPETANSSSNKNTEWPENRPAKRRKGNDCASVLEEKQAMEVTWIEKYDSTGLVPHYSHASQVPEHLQKCALVLNHPLLFHTAELVTCGQTFRSASGTSRCIQHHRAAF
jgi:trimethylguanosine synthase